MSSPRAPWKFPRATSSSAGSATAWASAQRRCACLPSTRTGPCAAWAYALTVRLASPRPTATLGSLSWTQT
eukprot:11159422-Lingulodinium_polyedra.AAC.1